jgi:vacuolar-type H+-ATPase subunit H
MNNHTVGLSKLIQQIKHDGVIAGKKKYNDIIIQANEKSKQIIDDAKRQSDKLILETKNSCSKKVLQMKSELKISARDFILKFRNTIKQRIIRPILKNKIDSIISNDNFMINCLSNIITNYIKANNEPIEIVVSKKVKHQLIDVFKNYISREMLDKSMIIFSEQKDLSGFKIKSSKENFIWDFSSETIAYELSRLIESSLADFLFREKKLDYVHESSEQCL